MVNDETIFHVVLNVNIVSVVSAWNYFSRISKTSVVSVVSDKITFHVVLSIVVVSVVSD